MQIELPEVRFHYGVRICPEPAHWGGLSGCTFKEGVSWGKFVSPEEGGRFAEVLCDATIAWPLLLKGVSQRLEKAPDEIESVVRAQAVPQFNRARPTMRAKTSSAAHMATVTALGPDKLHNIFRFPYPPLDNLYFAPKFVPAGDPSAGQCGDLRRIIITARIRAVNLGSLIL